MAFQLTNVVGTGTDQEILDWARAAIVTILATGQAYDNKGKSLDRADLAELRKTVDWLETRINSANTGGFAVNYATRGRTL
jgi:hypothetical protein